MSLWVAVIGCAGTLALAGLALGVAHVLTVVLFVALVGVWATLQFGSIYRDEPEIARFLERCELREGWGRGRSPHFVVSHDHVELALSSYHLRVCLYRWYARK